VLLFEPAVEGRRRPKRCSERDLVDPHGSVDEEPFRLDELLLTEEHVQRHPEDLRRDRAEVLRQHAEAVGEFGGPGCGFSFVAPAQVEACSVFQALHVDVGEDALLRRRLATAGWRDRRNGMYPPCDVQF
jgi:hypothetical protein